MGEGCATDARLTASALASLHARGLAGMQGCSETCLSYRALSTGARKRRGGVRACVFALCVPAREGGTATQKRLWVLVVEVSTRTTRFHLLFVGVDLRVWGAD